MWYLMTYSPQWITRGMEQSKEIGKTGKGSFRAHYAGTIHSKIIVAPQKILKNDPTEGGMERGITRTGYQRPTSRVRSQGYTYRNSRRVCIIAGNIGHIRDSKDIHWRREPSTRVE